jgi:hypothetical protein
MAGAHLRADAEPGTSEVGGYPLLLPDFIINCLAQPRPGMT